jgi:hypothetical protein
MLKHLREKLLIAIEEQQNTPKGKVVLEKLVLMAKEVTKKYTNYSQVDISFLQELKELYKISSDVNMDIVYKLCKRDNTMRWWLQLSKGKNNKMSICLK